MDTTLGVGIPSLLLTFMSEYRKSFDDLQFPVAA